MLFSCFAFFNLEKFAEFLFSEKFSVFLFLNNFLFYFDNPWKLTAHNLFSLFVLTLFKNLFEKIKRSLKRILLHCEFFLLGRILLAVTKSFFFLLFCLICFLHTSTRLLSFWEEKCCCFVHEQRRVTECLLRNISYGKPASTS